MFVIKRNKALPVFKTKTPAKFQQKMLQIGDNPFFKVAFSKNGFFFQTKKLQQVSVMENSFGQWVGD